MWVDGDSAGLHMLLKQNKGRDNPFRQDVICDMVCSQDLHRGLHDRSSDRVAISCGPRFTFLVSNLPLHSASNVPVLFLLRRPRATTLNQAVSPLADHITSDTMWGLIGLRLNGSQRVQCLRRWCQV
jgi:hypothetical protein